MCHDALEMKVEGVRLKGYDATYEKTTFDVIAKDGVLKICDLMSGVTFFINEGELDDAERSKKRVAKNQGHGNGYQGFRVGNRTTYDDSHENDAELQ